MSRLGRRKSFGYCHETCPDVGKVFSDFIETHEAYLPPVIKDGLSILEERSKEVGTYKLRDALDAACEDLSACEDDLEEAKAQLRQAETTIDELSRQIRQLELAVSP